MPARNQHYVPRIYTKAWETQVSSLREPHRVFTGIYYYEKPYLETGNGRNRESVLSHNHTYTVDFDYIHILPYCPKICEEYADSILQLLSSRGVTAQYNGQLLTNRNNISQNLKYIDRWTYIYPNGDLASSRSTFNAIKSIRCYCLENRFCTYMESDFENTIQSFLNNFPSIGVGEIRKTFHDSNLINDILKLTVLMFCRNPSFDLLGLYTWMQMHWLPEFFSQIEGIENPQEETTRTIRGLWLCEIYKALFDCNHGFSNRFLSSLQSNIQIVVFRVRTPFDGSFITSDAPVVFQNSAITTNQCPNGIYFPLTPKFLLFLCKRTSGTIRDVLFRTVGNDEIKRLNRVILNGAQKSIISVNKHLGLIL